MTCCLQCALGESCICAQMRTDRELAATIAAQSAAHSSVCIGCGLLSATPPYSTCCRGCGSGRMCTCLGHGSSAGTSAWHQQNNTSSTVPAWCTHCSAAPAAAGHSTCCFGCATGSGCTCTIGRSPPLHAPQLTGAPQQDIDSMSYEQLLELFPSTTVKKAAPHQIAALPCTLHKHQRLSAVVQLPLE